MKKLIILVNDSNSPLPAINNIKNAKQKIKLMDENNKPENMPAFPIWNELGHLYNTGLSSKDYAAIHLKQPISEHAWLNEAIMQAKKDELAAQAMQGIVTATMHPHGLQNGDANSVSEFAYAIASAMLKEREEAEIKKGWDDLKDSGLDKPLDKPIKL